MRTWAICSLTAVLIAATAGLAGCLQAGGSEVSAFTAYTETFGAQQTSDEDNGSGGGSGGEATDTFRRTMNVTLANNNRDAELNVLFAAWINPSSIRSADQQDLLLTAGYVQLSQEVKLGTAFTLPAGTFVLNGPGIAGAQAVRINPAAGTAEAPMATVETLASLITPDVILFFSAPPTSCETPAFFFTVDGDPANPPPISGLGGLFGGAATIGPVKTLSQIDAYKCEPFRPGMFLKIGGGAPETNEYFEGQDIRVDFFQATDAADNAAFVSLGEPP
jgi:hypothetical protein